MPVPSPPDASVAPSRRWPLILASCAVALAVALGAVLRVADPLSSSVIPAEDPYNHMALVREHLRNGELEPLNPGQTLYPPGLHAFIASAWVYTGADLYDLMRFGPVVLGAIGIVGMAVLLWRTAGPVAAVVGALALAVAPEAIFRSTMMSPTALDLAVLPFFLYAILRVLAGRLGWVGVAAPMAGFLAVSHPWLLGILGATGVAFLALAALLPWPSARGPPLTVPGIAGAVAVLGCGLGLSLLMPGFGSTLGSASTRLVAVGISLCIASVVPAALLLRWRDRSRSEAWLMRGPPGPLARTVASALIAVSLAAMVAAAARGGMPEFIDLPRMFGWPILVLAAAALVALPFIAGPAANLGAALTAVTLPFTIFNPLDSAFLPHRTAIFLGLGLVLLCGVAASALARAASRGWPALVAALAPPSTLRLRRSSAVAVPAFLVAALVAGSIYTATPDGYAGGWYRLYNECEIEALRDVAAQADADPDLVVLTGSWQAKLVLAALTEDSSRVWFNGDLYTSGETRDDLVASMATAGRPLLLVVDRHLAAETPGADVGFTTQEPWQPSGSWCANMGVPYPRVTAFSTGGAA